jgi:hypothetical protein
MVPGSRKAPSGIFRDLLTIALRMRLLTLSFKNAFRAVAFMAARRAKRDVVFAAADCSVGAVQTGLSSKSHGSFKFLPSTHCEGEYPVWLGLLL